jgi:RNA polymerase sigma-70 factor (ECF subfamily)
MQALLEKVLERLRGEAEKAGDLEQFQLLQPTLMADPDAPAYPRLAAQLGLSETAVRIKVHRLRGRFLVLLKEELRKR